MRPDSDRDPFIDLIAGIGPAERDGAAAPPATPPDDRADDREPPAPADPAAG